MPTPAAIIDMAASLMNDTAKTQYTYAACLPYLNMALDQLQEEMELNNVPITNRTSAVITVAAGVTRIDFITTPALPPGLIELQEVWESISGQTNWTPMTRREFVPLFFEGVITSQFLVYAWINEGIEIPEANQDNDLKLEYISSIFGTPIVIGDINTDLPVINAKSYLGYKTAALCAMYIGENETRAALLEAEATNALSRTLGISSKGKQDIVTRRRPFRSGYRNRGGY